MNAIAPAYVRPTRSFGWIAKAVIAPLLAAAISIASYAFGLGRSQAVQAEQLTRTQTDVVTLQRDKVSKDQFAEFQKSIEDLKIEVRQMHQDLTREMLRRR
jgi:hypothetical protein